MDRPDPIAWAARWPAEPWLVRQRREPASGPRWGVIQDDAHPGQRSSARIAAGRCSAAGSTVPWGYDHHVVAGPHVPACLGRAGDPGAAPSLQPQPGYTVTLAHGAATGREVMIEPQSDDGECAAMAEDDVIQAMTACQARFRGWPGRLHHPGRARASAGAARGCGGGQAGDAGAVEGTPGPAAIATTAARSAPVMPACGSKRHCRGILGPGGVSGSMVMSQPDVRAFLPMQPVMQAYRAASVKLSSSSAFHCSAMTSTRRYCARRCARAAPVGRRRAALAWAELLPPGACS